MAARPHGPREPCRARPWRPSRRRAAALAAAVAATTAIRTGSADPWYQGVESIKVLAPETASGAADVVRAVHQEMQFAQFTEKRVAILLLPGRYPGLSIPVGYYTSVIGVGTCDKDVVIDSFGSLDGLVGGATQNFWRSVEGVTAVGSTITWATSQGCPLRRSTVKGDLWLSMVGPPHWSSGGFMADVTVEGKTHVGTQQQFFFRNSKLKSGVDLTSGSVNFVFVGVEGGPNVTGTQGSPRPSVVNATPQVAEKPFLMEDQGRWFIVAPGTVRNVTGRTTGGGRIAMEDVFVAKAGDTAASMNRGISGKQALLLTPAIYGLDSPIRISQSGFLVLGIGFATLVATRGKPAIRVTGADVRIAGVLIEAGAPRDGPETEPLLLWAGNGGVMSDVFTRVGAFMYATGFHQTCLRTRADVHVSVDGGGVVLDNVWNWHADHDDCNNLSDGCYSRAGLVVRGRGVIAYGLAVEHMMGDMLEWHGDYGQVYFFQSEFPYHDAEFGKRGFVGYKVDPRVKAHTAVGVGLYIVGPLEVSRAMEVPPNVNLVNAAAWSINGQVSQFRSIVCTGLDDCFGSGDAACLGNNKCFFSEVPRRRGATPPGDQNASKNLSHIIQGKWQKAAAPSPPASPPPSSGTWATWPLGFALGSLCLLALSPLKFLAKCRRRQPEYLYTAMEFQELGRLSRLARAFRGGGAACAAALGPPAAAAHGGASEDEADAGRAPPRSRGSSCWGRLGPYRTVP